MQEKGFSGHNRGMCRKCGKLHRSNSGEKHHMKNHIYQERVRRKLLGRKKSEEHRLHLSMSHLGKVPVNKSHKFNGEVCPKCGRTHQNTIRGHKFNGMPCPVCGKTHKDTTGINNTGSTLIARKKKSDAAKGKPKPWFIGDNNPMRRMPELRESSRQRWKDPIFKKMRLKKCC